VGFAFTRYLFRRKTTDVAVPHHTTQHNTTQQEEKITVRVEGSGKEKTETANGSEVLGF